MKLGKLAELIGGRIVGNPDVEITGVSGLDDAQKGDITFLADKKGLKQVYKTAASAVIMEKEIKDFSPGILVVDNPRLAFAKTLEIFYVSPPMPLGVSGEAVIGSNVNFGNDVSVYPFVNIADNVSIGDGVTIFPGVYVGKGASIEEASVIHPNVTIREKVKIGKKVVIHAGAVIGSDGYGYVQDKKKHYKIPQVGGVIIGDDVEIGANTTIDRATVGNTVIGNGTKIDNLVQIAHNVKIGRNCFIVAQAAIGGSVRIGDGTVIAGQVGVRDHVKIGSRVMVGAQSGIGHDIPDGEIFSGTPAIPHKTWLRSQGIYNKLPEYVRRLRELERKINPVDNGASDGAKKEN